MTKPKNDKSPTAPPAKKTLAEAIAARKASLIPVEPAVPPPQTVIARKKIMLQDVARLEGYASELRGLSDLVDKMKRGDLEALAKALTGIEEAIKRVRKGMS